MRLRRQNFTGGFGNHRIVCRIAFNQLSEELAAHGAGGPERPMTTPMTSRSSFLTSIGA